MVARPSVGRVSGVPTGRAREKETTVISYLSLCVRLGGAGRRAVQMEGAPLRCAFCAAHLGYPEAPAQKAVLEDGTTSQRDGRCRCCGPSLGWVGG